MNAAFDIVDENTTQSFLELVFSEILVPEKIAKNKMQVPNSVYLE